MVFGLGLAVFVQLLVWRFVYPRAFTAESALPVDHTRPVSVIVCFRNEAAGLGACLSGILAQTHPAFEVIAVDDHSTDGSAAIVDRLALTHPNLRLLRPGATRAGKKDALTAGIRAACHELLLLTDADCVPASPQWLSRMTAPLATGAEVVLGASPYYYAPGLLPFWQRFESTYTALQYLGFARLGLPYMGVGRNLAYRKSFFLRAGGLASHAHLPGGDDDLLINAHALPEATVCVTDPAAWTYSTPTHHLREYIRQKLRHQSAGTQYTPRHQALLVTIALSHGLSFLLGCCLLFTPLRWWAAYIYLVRIAAVYPSLEELHARYFLGGHAGAGPIGRAIQLVIADMLYAPYSVFLLAAGLVGSRKW